MEIESHYVGATSTPLTVALSPRQTMNYAAALGDTNPMYFDDLREEGIWAPPMLAVALTWPLSSRFNKFWGNTDFPVEAQQRQVHYNESISWIRPIRPDETLEIQGTIVAMEKHPAGTLITIRYDARGRDGVNVFTEHIGGLLRGVTLRGENAVMEAPPVPVPAPTDSGEIWSKNIAVDSLAAHVYDGCTDIVFPIHTSVAFARHVGLTDPIYHGTATLGLAVREILNRKGSGDPTTLSSVNCGFRGMVTPGTSITVRFRAILQEADQRVVYFDVANDTGDLAIRDGRVVLRHAS